MSVRCSTYSTSEQNACVLTPLGIKNNTKKFGNLCLFQGRLINNNNNNNNNNLYLYSAISTKKPIALNNGYYIQNIKINLDKKERNINIYSNLKYNII